MRKAEAMTEMENIMKMQRKSKNTEYLIYVGSTYYWLIVIMWSIK